MLFLLPNRALMGETFFMVAVSLYLHQIGHFPGEPGLASVY